jgi:hypothetical protein
MSQKDHEVSSETEELHPRPFIGALAYRLKEFLNRLRYPCVFGLYGYKNLQRIPGFLGAATGFLLEHTGFITLSNKLWV